MIGSLIKKKKKGKWSDWDDSFVSGPTNCLHRQNIHWDSSEPELDWKNMKIKMKTNCNQVATRNVFYVGYDQRVTNLFPCTFKREKKTPAT